MKSPTESPERTSEFTAPWHRRHGRSPFLTALMGALIGAILAVAAGLLYLRFDPLPNAGSVVAAPVVQSNGGGALDAAAIYKADVPGIVLIKSRIKETTAGPFGFPRQQRGTALGSGFMVDGQGRILTNFHVVSGASKISVTLHNHKAYNAELVGSDPSNDIAVLKISAPGSGLKPLPLGDSSKLRVGQPAVAIGNPLGYSSTESEGIVSALNRDIQAPNGFTIPGAIQTDASLTSGNSGGPLIDSSGRVIGINSQVAANADGSGQANDIGFAVPINLAKDALRQLDRAGEITRPYLGVSGYGITPEPSSFFPAKKGVVVAEVVPGGPADKAGITGGDRAVRVGGSRLIVGGDVILDVGAQPVSDMGELQALISKYKMGQQVTLKILRGSQTTSVQVTLGNRPANIQG